MTVPTHIEFGNVKPGQVISNDLIQYFIKVNINTAVNLATGSATDIPDPTSPYTLFPAAALVLG